MGSANVEWPWRVVSIAAAPDGWWAVDWYEGPTGEIVLHKARVACWGVVELTNQDDMTVVTGFDVDGDDFEMGLGVSESWDNFVGYVHDGDDLDVMMARAVDACERQERMAKEREGNRE